MAKDGWGEKKKNKKLSEISESEQKRFAFANFISPLFSVEADVDCLETIFQC